MPHVELDIPDIRVVVRQPSVIIDRSKLPIQSVAEIALTASYANYAKNVDAFNIGIVGNISASGAVTASQLYAANGLIVSGAVSASVFTGSFVGDGSQLSGLVTVLRISGSTSGNDTVFLLTDALNISGSNGISATVSDNTITIGAPLGTVTSSAQVIGLLPLGTVSSSGQIFYADITDIPVGIVSSSTQVTALLPNGTVSSSIQVDVRNTTGIETIATTGSNTFTGIQTISNGTNSTTTSNGALIVSGGVGIGGNLNVSGSVYIAGLLTAVSTSIQYVTSSQLNIGVSRILLNDDDVTRFAGISIFDSGSTNATASILWDSVNHKFVYEAAGVQSYTGGILIAGPRNTGALGNERTLISGRVPVSVGGDHIDTAIESSSIRIDFTSGTTHIEKSLYVTGSINATTGITASVSGALVGSFPYTGLLNIPVGIVSSSTQVIPLLPNGVVSSSTQVFYNSLQNIPTGILSSSVQFNALTNTTASFAISASYVSGAASTWETVSGKPTGLVSSSTQAVTWAVSSSLFASTSSFANSALYSSLLNIPEGLVSASAQINTGSFSGSFIGIASSATSASHALTASYVPGAASDWNSLANKPNGLVSSSTQATTWSVATAAIAVTASAATSITFIPPSASFAATASYALNALGNASASWASQSISSSYAITASYALNSIGGQTNSASYAETASYSVTASYLLSYPAFSFDGGTPSSSFVSGPVFDCGGVI